MHPYQDPKLPIPERVSDLLSRMTLREKVVQLFHHWKSTDTHETLNTYKADGVGTVYQQWVDVKELQRHCVENTRLGIPANVAGETLHGATGKGTIFPMPNAMAASWNPELLHRVYTHIAKEARMRGVNNCMAPVLDVHLDPRFGRIDEGFGEDPFLTSRIAEVCVRALQGEGETIDSEHIAVTAKHFVAYGHGENGQDGGAADLSEQVLREIHLRPFKAAVDAGLMGIMGAHQEVNGVPCHANEWLLRDILRDEWGFKGVLLSDAGDVNILCSFGLAKDYRDAGVQALTAGVDQEMYVAGFEHLEAAVQDGELEERLIDEAVARVLRFKFICGLFENPYPQWCDDAELDSPEGRQLAYQVAAEGMVLLKNENNFLPIDPSSVKTVAVIGPNINHLKNQHGCYTRTGAHTVTPLEGLRNRLPADVEVLSAEGCSIMDDSEDGLAEAVAIAQQADLVVLVVGDAFESCRECYGAKTGDRTQLNLSGGQSRLVREVAAANANTVLTLINGRPQAIVQEQDLVPAVVEAWRCGEEGGNALADILLGKVNPSGRITTTFPRSSGQLPMYYHRKKRGFRNRMYTFESPDPLYPFGYGLSYTRFDWSDFELFPETVNKESEVTARISITNTGDRDGSEVVQIYMRDPLASMTRPIRKLVGFQKVHLKPGETKTLEIPVPVSEFGYYDRKCRFVIDEGTIELIAARHAQDEGLRREIMIGQSSGVDTRAALESDRVLIPD
jgi:beta-glucosidase